MTAFKLTSLAATLLVASATTWAQTPDQRALALALSVADKGLAQQARLASATTRKAAPAALAAGVTTASQKKDK
jgi:hypothetical protein